MKKFFLFLFFMLMSVNVTFAASQDHIEWMLFSNPVPQEYNGEYRIGVRTSGTSCELTLYQIRNGYHEKIFSCPGNIGRNGAGKAVAGDEKTPLGIFTIGNAYGIKDDPGSKIPYEKITADLYWRGDSTQSDYNSLGRASKLPRGTDFSNDEHLINYEGVYNYLIDFGYNPERIPYAGSALFLHCWYGPGIGTGGCVAIAEENMIRILQTITPGTKMIIY